MNIKPLKSGTAITRQYNNAKKIAISTGVGSGVALSSLIHCFETKKPIQGGFSLAGLAVLFDTFSDSITHMKKLYKPYKEIVKRAKSIYNK